MSERDAESARNARYTAAPGSGAAAAAVPLYLAEMAPVHARGRMVTINELMIVSGQLLAFVMNAILDQIIQVGSTFFVIKFAPETRGRTLKELEDDFRVHDAAHFVHAAPAGVHGS